MMQSGLFIYLCFSLAAANIALYGFNFHFYSFPVTMWACLRLARPLIMMIVVQCRAEVLSAGWKRPQLLFRCTLVAAVAALYVWFFVQLSVSVTRFLMLFVVDVVVNTCWVVTKLPIQRDGKTVSERAASQFRLDLLRLVVDTFDHCYCISVLPAVFGGSASMDMDVSLPLFVAFVVLVTSALHQLSSLLSIQGVLLMLHAEELGMWRRIRQTPATKPPAWEPGRVYTRGDVVYHDDVAFKAMCHTNNSTPGCSSCNLLQIVVGQPAWTQTLIICGFTVVIMCEMAMALVSLYWPFYLLLLAGSLFAFSTCALGLRAIEHVFDGGMHKKGGGLMVHSAAKNQ